MDIEKLRELIKRRRRQIQKNERKKSFDKLPKETRAKLTELGLSPYQDDDIIIRRTTGGFVTVPQNMKGK